VIARIWSARATPALAPAYADHLRSHVLPILRAVDGYVGATLLQRRASAGLEIVVITWWQSLEAIHAFAGTDIDAAVVADEAASLLTQFDRRARHYAVVMEDATAGPGSPGDRA
jgi:heme-degrading monooxygenase HmoA